MERQRVLVLLKLSNHSTSEVPLRQRKDGFPPAKKLLLPMGHCFHNSFDVTRKWDRNSSEEKENKNLTSLWHKAMTSFPSYLISVMRWKNLFATLHYKKNVLFSHFQCNYISALEQQEISMKSWKGAVNINIIQLLGTNITQQTLYNEQSSSSSILLLC